MPLKPSDRAKGGSKAPPEKRTFHKRRELASKAGRAGGLKSWATRRKQKEELERREKEREMRRIENAEDE
jgi:hypothetical protein